MKEANFKETEIGKIPVDWEARKLGDLIDFVGGSQPPLYNFSLTKKHNYVRLIQIRDYKSDRFKVYISKTLTNKFCGVDDIMIGRYGPPIFQILKGIKGAYNVALLKAIPTDEIDKNYTWQFLRNKSLFNFVEKLSQRSSGQTGIDLAELKQYQIPLPPLAEQEKIAEVLSDTDLWIESTEALLAKKRQIKKGAMQKLLSPKEDWEVRKLGEVCVFQNGLGHEQFESEFGKYIVVNSKFISTESRVKRFSHKNLVPLQKYDIVIVMSDIPNGKALAKCFYIDKNNLYTLNQRIGRISINDDFDSKFLFYLLNRNKYFLAFDGGSGQTNLRKQEVLDCPIHFPPLKTQQEIAEILSSMDLEIESLENRLQKARQLKQGMMQDLLTGKVRLV